MLIARLTQTDTGNAPLVLHVEIRRGPLLAEGAHTASNSRAFVEHRHNSKELAAIEISYIIFYP